MSVGICDIFTCTFVQKLHTLEYNSRILITQGPAVELWTSIARLLLKWDVFLKFVVKLHIDNQE